MGNNIARPRTRIDPCTISVIASASMPPETVYAMTTAAAIVTAMVTPSSEDAESTWPKARICAAAHRSEVGTMRIAVIRSADPEKRTRKKSAIVVRFIFQRGMAKRSPIRIRHTPYPNGSAETPASPFEYAAPAVPIHDSAPNQVAKIEKVASPYPNRRPASR